MSIETRFSMPGRSTFTATSRAVVERVARWTTAIDRAADRHLVEAFERVLERHAQVGLHHPTDVLERHRGAGVETGPELAGHVVAEHAGRAGDELAELHERRARAPRR